MLRPVGSPVRKPRVRPLCRRRCACQAGAPRPSRPSPAGFRRRSCPRSSVLAGGARITCAPHADRVHDDEPHDGKSDPDKHGADVQKHSGRAAGLGSIRWRDAEPHRTPAGAGRTARRDRVPAPRSSCRCWRVAGVICLLIGGTIGWFIMAAPVVGLGVAEMFVVRPALELTRDGLVFRQYPYSGLARWDVIESSASPGPGNRVILGYKLVDGIPPPRHQPARTLLLARSTHRTTVAGSTDSTRGWPGGRAAVVQRYLDNPALREVLPVTRR